MSTKDCAEILEKTLPLLLWADEVIIADVSTSSAVRDLAYKYSPKVKYFKTDIDDMMKRYLSLEENITSDYVFGVDSDEFITEELANEILDALVIPCQYNGFFIRADNYFFGARFGLSHPHLRIWRLGKVNIPVHGSAHLHPSVSGPTRVLTQPFIHDDNPKLGLVAVKHFRYSAILASRMTDQELKLESLESIGGLQLFFHVATVLLRATKRCLFAVIRYRKNGGFAALCHGYQSLIRVIAEDVAATEESRMRAGTVERHNRGYW